MRVGLALLAAASLAGQAGAVQVVLAPRTSEPLVVPGPPAPGGAFEFKGFRSGVAIDLRQLPMDKCKVNERQNTLDCTYFDETVAGWTGVLIYEFNGNKLYAVLASLSERAYPDILDAFNAKYGTPCASRGAGEFMDFDWCFKTGILTVTRLVPSNPGKMSIMYIDNDKPVVKPKVDF